ncbi:MAG TPA: ATP-binding protein [Terriglobia bacterium]|nr:ATP-binding protein [Terriglobia bacterium]
MTPSSSSIRDAKILKLSPEEVAFPLPAAGEGPADTFKLSSHARAHDSLDLALSISGPGFNVFVLGEDRCGRMSTTIEYLRSRPQLPHLKRLDWLYLTNFWTEREPFAFSLLPGEGRRFKEHLEYYLRRLQKMMSAALNGDVHKARADSLKRETETEIATLRDHLERTARAAGFDLVRTEDKLRLADRPESTARAEQRHQLQDELALFEQEVSKLKAGLDAAIGELDRETLAGIISTEAPAFIEPFRDYPELRNWIDDLNTDLLESVRSFARAIRRNEEEVPPRYRANLFIDQTDTTGPLVILEPNPTYENLFGYIEYRRGEDGSETDHTLIRPGALHRANGGILVLRAEALANDETAWRFLKAGLRDGTIRIEELHRAGSMPTTGTPRPQPIPLEAKIVIVGSPETYYRFFSNDAEFRTYFKIKAEIDPDMPASPANIAIFSQLLRQMVRQMGASYDDSALPFLLGLASRWAARRDQLTARIEVFEDLLREAQRLSQPFDCITADILKAAWSAQRRRNSRSEERFLENLRRGYVAISTKGTAIGQINALTVRDLGDQAFGRPSRVTARASIGRRGILNIERIVDLGGKSQQKGVLVVEGYLRGRFGRTHPLSFDCSLTFEQNYGGVDGDSASVAELVAILSALSHTPVRQDIAVTGSFNQLGEVQAVGDVIEKIEGFFRATAADRQQGGQAGVIIPAANVRDLVLEDCVVEAMAAGQFHLWGIHNVDDAAALLCAERIGDTCDAERVYQRVDEQLTAFNQIIRENALLFPQEEH